MQALIWSKMSTGLPIDIYSAMQGQNYISFCRLDIDIHKYGFFKHISRNISYIFFLYVSFIKHLLFELMLEISFDCVEIFLIFMYMKSGTTMIDGMEQKFKLQLKEIGQLIVQR